MKRLFPVLLLALLFFGSLQSCVWAAVTPPEKTASGSPAENPNKYATFNPVLTIQLQRDREMWGEGVVLDVDVGPNLYAYVRQNPWSSFDPLGLAEREDPDGFKWKGTDHHMVPREVGRDSGLGPKAKAVFDDPDNLHRSRVPTAEHNFQSHGHYNREVAAEWAEYATKHAPDGIGDMSQRKQVKLAKGFVEHIRNTDNEFIQGFNNAARDGTPADVKKWFNSTGKNIGLKATGKKAGAKGPIKIVQGIAKTARVGGKIIMRGVPIIGGALTAATIANAAPEDRGQVAVLTLTGGDIAQSVLTNNPATQSGLNSIRRNNKNIRRAMRYLDDPNAFMLEK